MVYDVGNRESFEALDSWLEEIKKDIGSPADLEGVVFAVCANKVRSRRKTITITYIAKKSTWSRASNQLKTCNLSRDNFKKHITLMARHLNP